MTPKERAAMQQALEALQEYRDTQMIKAPRRAITALREALAGDNMSPTEQAEQEPVGYFAYDEEHDIWEELTGPNAPGATPLYAAPVRTKDLTPDELFSIANKVGFDGELMKTNHDRGMPSIAEQYARAVIAADREKNK